MDIKLTVALIGIVGVLTSGLVQFLLGRLSERTKKADEVRSQAYLDFVNSVSDIASTSKANNGKLEIEQLKNLISSKTRVVLIGSNEVVMEIQHYFSKHNKLDSNQSFDDFSKIVAAMRKDLTGKNSLNSKVLTSALFGS